MTCVLANLKMTFWNKIERPSGIERIDLEDLKIDHIIV